MINIGETMSKAETPDETTAIQLGYQKMSLEFEYNKTSLEMVTKEWGFMYDVVKTAFSSLLVSIPIYLSIIGFLSSYLEPKYRGWIIGLCSVILVVIPLLVYYCYHSFVEIRLQLLEEIDIYKFLEYTSKQCEPARKRIEWVLALYVFAQVVFIIMILILNFMIWNPP